MVHPWSPLYMNAHPSHKPQCLPITSSRPTQWLWHYLALLLPFSNTSKLSCFSHVFIIFDMDLAWLDEWKSAFQSFLTQKLQTHFSLYSCNSRVLFLQFLPNLKTPSENPINHPDLSMLCQDNHFHFTRASSISVHNLWMIYKQQAGITTLLLLYSSCSLSYLYNLHTF